MIDKVSSESSRNRLQEFLLMLVLVVPLVGTAAVLGWRNYHTPYGPDVAVAAQPFRWPARCSPANYAVEDRVPKSCAYSNRIRNPRRLGLIHEPRNFRWYRIGNDALLMRCLQIGNHCTVWDRRIGKFIPTNG